MVSVGRSVRSDVAQTLTPESATELQPHSQASSFCLLFLIVLLVIVTANKNWGRPGHEATMVIVTLLCCRPLQVLLYSV